MIAAAALAGCSKSSSPKSEPAVLAATPPMGFNDWNSFGCNVDEKLIVETADLFVETGLKDAGYRYINIDDCWSTANATDAQAARDADGRLVPDPTKFPHGMKWLADYVHSKGLKLGIYSSAGYSTCQRVYPGSLGHETADAQTFADWGIDYLKYDNCGEVTDGGSNDNSAGWADQAAYRARYQAMADAIAATGREMVYSVCEWGNYEPWTWVPSIGGQLWRTTMDISDSYGSMLSLMKQNVVLADYAGPGRWNDPDMLEVGNGGMTTAEYKSHFTLWAMMAAPLIIGTDLRQASAETLAILTNKDVIAVDQDPLGKQATLVSGDSNGLYVLAKPLSDGDVAVALFNSTGAARTISTTAVAARLASAKDYRLTDLWTKQVTETAGAIAAFVPPHATTVYRVEPSRSTLTEVAPSAVLSVSASPAQVSVSGSTTVTVTLTNQGANALSGAVLAVDAPGGGWGTALSSGAFASQLAAGESTSAVYTVSAPASAADLIGTATLSVEVTFASSAGTSYLFSDLDLTLVQPVSSDYATADLSGESSAVFAQSGDVFEILAAGKGVSPVATTPFGTSAATDQYAAIYLDDEVTSTDTVMATVTDTTATSGGFGSSSGQAGIILRNDMTGADGLPGVVLYVSTTGSVGMYWNAGGGAAVDSPTSSFGPPGSGGGGVTLPVVLRLVRSGTSVEGAYSTDGGTTWTVKDTATLAATAAAATQDAGMYFASGTQGALYHATFSGFSVTH